MLWWVCLRLYRVFFKTSSSKARLDNSPLSSISSLTPVFNQSAVLLSTIVLNDDRRSYSSLSYVKATSECWENRTDLNDSRSPTVSCWVLTLFLGFTENFFFSFFSIKRLWRRWELVKAQLGKIGKNNLQLMIMWVRLCVHFDSKRICVFIPCEQ